MAKRRVSLMIDSGAFSAWRSGISIDIGQYGDYIERYRRQAYAFVNLDVIPGRFKGAKPSDNQIEAAARQSWANYLQLRARGLPVMPVFHRGERLYWLEKMIGEGVEFIGLGGIAMGTGIAQRREWLDQVFSHICDSSTGWPPVKLHGFGIASVDLMSRYPWYSVDSTSWKVPGMFGKVLMPRLDRLRLNRPLSQTNPVVDFTQTNHIIVNPAERKNEPGDHVYRYELMGRRSREFIFKYFNSLGCDFEVDRLTTPGRYKMTVRHLQNVLRNISPHGFQGTQHRSVFQTNKFKTDRQYIPRRFRFFFGISTIGDNWELLKQLGVRDRLVPFPAIRPVSKDNLKFFVNTGQYRSTRNGSPSTAGTGKVGRPRVRWG